MTTSKLYYEARNTAHNILWSEYPHDRRIRAYRKAIVRCSRRKRAMRGERGSDMWCDSRGKLHETVMSIR